MADDAPMNTDTTPIESPETHSEPPRRTLVRPTAGRSIAGVAAGLAAYLNVSVGLVRFAFLVAVIFGGAGLFLYAAGWLLIRDEAESESIAQRVLDNLGAGPSWFGVVLLVIGAVIVVDIFTFLPRSLIWAAVLLAVGLLLYRGDIGERAPHQPAAASPSPVTERTADPAEGGYSPPTPPGGEQPRRPVPSPTPPPPPPPPPSILGRLTVGVGLLALGVMAIADNVTTLIEPQPRHYLAMATVVLGLGLLVGAFVGRARWMILLGVFLLPPLVFSPAAEVDWRGDFDRVVVVDDLDALQGSYRATVGSLRFDLTEADWDGQTVELDVDLGAGEVVVALPDGVGVSGSANVGVGAIDSPDGDRGGLGGISRGFDLPGDRGTLDLDIEVGAGVVEVHTGEESGFSFRESWNIDLGRGVPPIAERNR